MARSRDTNSGFLTAFDVLVVDANPAELNAVKVYLQNAGYRVFAASNGKSAAEALHRYPVRLVLTDLFLSDDEGLELLLGINATGKEMPVIGMSNGDSAVSASLMEHLVRHYGARQVLAKPLTPLEVLVAVRNVIGQPATERTARV